MPTDVMTDQDVNHLLRLAAGYATWVTGMPDAEMMNILHQAQEHLRIELALKFGPDVANAIADAFPAAVLSARRAIEAKTPSVTN
jgi:hypothetical protein